MTPSLAQSLVDAAARGMAGETEADEDLPGWSGRGLAGDARAAALSILEMLAEQNHEFAYLNGGDFQDLADAIRESPCP